MDGLFDDIRTLAAGVNTRISLEDAAEAYEKDGVTRMLKLWRSFAVLLPPEISEAEQTEPFQSPPAIFHIKAYFMWRVRTAQARLDTRITVQTMIKELQQLQRCVRLGLDHTYNNKEKAELKSFVKSLAEREDASTKARPKAVALYIDSEEIITFQWCCDEYVYVHPRIMIQITFFILVASIWGLRPGEIVESSTHRGSNEGFKYGDIKLSLARTKDGLRYQIAVKLRNRKFKRGKEGEACVGRIHRDELWLTSIRQTVTLYEETDPEKTFVCPVRWFLSMALADDVFTTHKTLKDFEHRWIPNTANSRLIPIRTDKTDIPILRKLSGSKISPNQIMTATSISKYLGDLGVRCGYEGPVTSYIFRRGFANGVEGKVSSGKFRQAISHKNDHQFQSYVSSTVGIDAQNIVKNLPEDREHVDFTRSIGFTRDLNAPKPHGSVLGKRISNPSNEVVEKVTAKFPKTGHGEIMRKARRMQFLEDRELYYQKDRLEDTGSEEDSSRATVYLRIRPKPSRLFEQMLKYNSDQASLIKGLWSSKPISIEDSVRSILPFANPSKFQVRYSQRIKLPKANRTCPYCGRNLTKINDRSLALHLLRCHCINNDIDFCHDCVQFSDQDPDVWGTGEDKSTVGHQCHSSGHDDLSCGVVYWRSLLIRQGRCPFCPKRLATTQNQRKHIEKHLFELREGPFKCSHWLCQRRYSSIDELRAHLITAHGLELYPLAVDSSKQNRDELNCKGSSYEYTSGAESLEEDCSK